MTHINIYTGLLSTEKKYCFDQYCTYNINNIHLYFYLRTQINDK